MAATKSFKHSKTASKKYLLALAVAAAIGFGVARPAAAGVYTWSNGNGDLAWNTSSNNDWTGAGTTWVNSNDAIFGVSGVGTITVQAGGITANTITFNTAGYTLTGGVITLNNGHDPEITANQNATINSNIILSGGQTWNVASGKTLTLGGTVNGSAAGTAFGIGGAGSYLFNGSIGSNVGSVLFNSASGTNTTATFTTANTFTGQLWLGNGGNATTLNFSDVNQLGTGTGANFIAIQNNSTLVYTGTGTQSVTGRQIYWNAGAANINIVSSTANLTLDVTTAGAARTQTLTKLGAGTLTIMQSGAVTDTYSATGTSFAISGGTLAFNPSTTATTIAVTTPITGSGALSMVGIGTLALSAANTYTGNTLVSAGILALSNNLALQNSTLDTSGAGHVTLSVTTPTFGGLIGSTNLATVITTGYSGVTALTLNPGVGVTDTYSGVIANGAAGMTLTKNGAGTQVLSGSNTYSGSTNLNGGILSVTSDSNLGNSSGTLSFNTGTLFIGGSGTAFGTTSRPITLAGAGTIDTGNAGNTATFNGNVNNGANLLTLQGNGSGTYGGNIGSSTGGLTKSGTGTWTLSGSNTYTGTTTINGGVLTVSGGVSTGSNIFVSNIGSGTSTMNLTGGSITLSSFLDISQASGGTGVFNQTGGKITGVGFYVGNVGTGTFNQTGGTASFTSDGTNDVFIGNSGSSVGSLIENGGTLTLSPTAGLVMSNGSSNSSTLTLTSGLINQTSGFLDIGQSGTAAYNQSGGTYTLTGGGNTYVGHGAAGNMTVSGGLFTGATMTIADGGGAGTLTVSGTGAVTVTTLTMGGGAGAGTINLNGGTLTVSSIAKAAGGTDTLNFNGGTLTASASFNSPASLGTVVQSNGAVIDTSTFAVGITTALTNGGGSGGLIKAGVGSLTLSGANTYTGATTLSNGTLILNSNTTADTTGYTLGDSNTGSNNIVLKVGAGFNTNNTTVATIGSRLINVTVTNQGSGTATIDVSAAGTNSDLILALNRATILKGPENQLLSTISGPGAGAGNDSLILDVNGGTFLWTSNGTVNTFTGNVHIINSSGTAGTLQMQNNSYIANDAAHQNLMIPDTASVNLDSNITWAIIHGVETIDGLNGSGSIRPTSGVNYLAGSPILTVGASNGNGTFSGVMFDSGVAFTFGKTGTGTETLTGSNTYTGITTINGGVLAVNAVATGVTAQPLGENGSLTLAGGTLRYTGGGGTLDKTITVNTATTGTISNTGGGTMTLTGGISKNGSTLILAGGNFNVTTKPITGALAGSDLIVSGSTVTLGVTNTYNGPTSIVSGGKIVLGVNNAIPSNSAVTLGDGSTTGALTMSTFTDAIGSLSFGVGTGTVAMAADQTGSAQLSTSGALNFSGGNTINLTGMLTAAPLYKLISGTSITGTFTTVTGLDSNYILRYGTVNANELDAQEKADQTVTGPIALGRIIAGQSFTGVSLGTLNNTSQAGSSALAVSLSATDSGSPAGAFSSLAAASGSTLAAATSTNLTGNFTTTGSTALGTRNFTISNTDGNAIPTTASLTTGSVDVVTSRVITAGSVNFGRVLLGNTAAAQSSALSTSGSHDTTADLSVKSGASGSNANITASSGSLQLFDSAASTGSLSVSNSTAFGSVGTQSGTVTLAGGTGNFTGELTGQTLGPITVGYLIDPVNERAYTNPSTLDLGNLLLNANQVVSSAQTITTAGLHDVTTDATLAAYGGSAINGLTLTGGPISINGSNATDSITRTIAGTLTTSSYSTNGTYTFHMDSTDEFANVISNAAGVSYTVNVGNAMAALSDRGGTNTANRLAYQMTSTEVGSQTLFNGTVLTAVVGNTGSYAGLASRTMAGSTVLGTVATILDGANSSGSNRTVTMTWRDRSSIERPNGISPPLPTPSGSQRYLISDVVLLTGMDSGPGTITDTNHSIPGNPYTITTHQTDDFVLQMSYSGGAIPTLDWLDLLDSTWKLANAGDFTTEGVANPALANNASGGEVDYVGSFSSFQTAYGSDLSTYLGAYGYDPTNYVAWAVINHNSQFAVVGEVPEPTSLGLLGLGALSLLSRRRKSRR